MSVLKWSLTLQPAVARADLVLAATTSESISQVTVLV